MKSLPALLKENRCGLVLLTLFAYLLIQPFFMQGLAGRVIIGVLVTTVLFSAVYAVAESKNHIAVVVAISLIALLSAWGASVTGSKTWFLFSDISNVIAYFYIVGILLAYVLRDGRVTADKLFAGVSVYLFLGILWGRLYHALALAIPGSFAGNGLLGGTEHVGNIVDYTYYSFVTLTTLGYGEIVPVTPPARSFAILEAAVGVLYLAILISRLASLYRRQSAFTEKE